MLTYFDQKVVITSSKQLPSISNRGQIIDQIGNTPLIRLQQVIPKNQEIILFAKAEWMNPGGSVKDRPALWMLNDAIEQNLLTPDKIVLDATSGNTGIGYAMVCAALGLKLQLCIPKNASPERLKILKTYGADLVLTDPLEGIDGAIMTAQSMVDADPDIYFYADQYNNEANWQSHYYTTGKEIWQQTEGLLTHFIAGLGTTGTMMGVSRRLKKENPNIRCYGVQPDSIFHGIEGLKHLESSIVPGIYDPTYIDGDIRISSEEAYRFTKRLAKEEGLFVGISAGAALAASFKVAAKLDDQGVLVVIFPDRGDRYLSEKFWE